MGNNFNFHQLELFYRVAELGSFSKAAEELFISQPAISAQIRELETILGLKLLERAGRTLSLTQAGQLVYKYSQEIFQLARQMERGLNDLKGLASGHLTLASSTTVGECLLPQIMGKLKASYPGIELELQITNSAGVVTQVLQRQIDLGFVGEEVAPGPLLEVRPFFTDEIVFFVGTAHPLAAKAEVTIAELIKDETAFVSREAGSATRRWAEKALGQAGFIPLIAVELGSNEAVKRAVSAGLGAGMLSSLSLGPEVKAGMLKIIPIREVQCQRHFSIIYRKDRELTQAEQRFLEVTLATSLTELTQP